MKIKKKKNKRKGSKHCSKFVGLGKSMQEKEREREKRK
jgi:hypothetical protein